MVADNGCLPPGGLPLLSPATLAVAAASLSRLLYCTGEFPIIRQSDDEVRVSEVGCCEMTPLRKESRESRAVQ